MNENTNTITARTLNTGENTGIVSNLYSLVEAVKNETKPGEEYIISTIVKRILNSGKVKLLCSEPDCSNFIN